MLIKATEEGGSPWELLNRTCFRVAVFLGNVDLTHEWHMEGKNVN